MQQKVTSLLLRWLLNSLGLYLAVSIFGTGYTEPAEHVVTFLVAGLMLSAANAFLRPYAIVFSLPALLFTYGMFILIVNGVMVYLAALATPYLHITFLHAILAGVVVTLVNYIVRTAAHLQVIRRLREV